MLYGGKHCLTTNIRRIFSLSFQATIISLKQQQLNAEKYHEKHITEYIREHLNMQCCTHKRCAIPLRIYFREFPKILSLLSNVRALSLMEIIMLHCHKQTLSRVCDSMLCCICVLCGRVCGSRQIVRVQAAKQDMGYSLGVATYGSTTVPEAVVAATTTTAKATGVRASGKLYCCTTTKYSRNMANDACQLSFVHATCKCVLNI